MTAAYKAKSGPFFRAGALQDKTVPWPTGHAAGEYAILVALQYVPAATAIETLDVAAGFTLIDTVNQVCANDSIQVRMTTWYCVATSGSMTAPAVAPSANVGGGSDCALMYTFTGALNAAPDAHTTSTTLVNAISIAGVTTTAGNDLVINLAFRLDDTGAESISGWTNANLAGLAEKDDTRAFDGETIGLATGIKATAGATGATTATWASATNYPEGDGFTIALKSGPPLLTSVTVTPSSTSVPVGTAVPLTVTGHFDDSTTANLTAVSTYHDANAHTSTLGGVSAASSVGVGYVTAIAPTAASYPSTAAQLATATGYGTWATGWTFNEASSPFTATFGSPTLTLQSGTPNYQLTGPIGDLGVGFKPDGNTTFSGGNVFNVGTTTDLAIAWVGFHSAFPASTRILVGKGTGTAPLYYVLMDNFGNLQAHANDGTTNYTSGVTIPVGHWYVGMMAIDRGAGKLRVATCNLDGSGSQLGPATTIAAVAFATANNFLFGAAAGVDAVENATITTMFVANGTGVAANMSANLATAAQNLSRAIMASGSVSDVAEIVVTMPTADQNEHHPWPGVARGVWDHDGEQIVWTGDRVLVAREGDYSLGSSAFWNRNTAGDLLKRGLPAYLPLQTDVIPAVTAFGANSYIETCLTPTLRAVICTLPSTIIDVFDRETNALVRHREFPGEALNARIMMSGDHLIATWMSNSPGPLLMSVWTGDDWTTPQTLVVSVLSYECAVAADCVHFIWCTAGATDPLQMGRMVGVSAASVPYAWGTNVGGAATGLSSIALGIAPDNTIGIAFYGDGSLQATVYSADLSSLIFNQNLDSSFDSFGGLSICSRGLKNANGEYEWLVHYRNPLFNGAACIRSFYPIAGQTSVVEKRFNTYFLSKSFRVGDEVFIWAVDANANTAFLLGGHYKAQTCGFADREVANFPPEDGTTTFLHQVLPDPLTSGDRSGPFTIKKIGGTPDTYDTIAASSQPLAGDGYFMATATETNTFRFLALTDANTTDWTTFRYAFRFRSDVSVDIIEQTNVIANLPYTTGDKFVLRRHAHSITYEKNGVVLHTSTAVTTPLIALTLFYSAHASLGGVGLNSVGTPVEIVWDTNAALYSETSGYGPTQTGTRFTWGRQFNTGQAYAHPGNARIGDLEFLPQLSTAAYGGCTYISGSAVRCWDGAVLGDAGFQSYPVVDTLTASAGGTMDPGDKRFRCYIVRYNQAGERFECGAVTSDPITVTLNQKVAVVIQTVPCTNHPDAVIEVFTTEAGGTTFYFDGTVANDMTVPSVTYTSSVSDTVLRSRPADVHATGVGQAWIVETFGPLGSSILATSGDRLWGAGGQVPQGIVQFSTLHVDGSAAGFDDLSGTQEVDTEGGIITSICRSGDATVVWEASKLFVISGVGPDNYGSGSFSIPEIVLTDGATTHLGTILTPNGPVYWGDGGPRVISSGYHGMNISLPVQILAKKMTPSGVRVDTTAQEVIWYTSDGDALLWNYMGGNSRFARWSNLKVAAASPSALAMTNGKLFYPSHTANGDDGGQFQFKLRTGLIKAEQLIGGGTKIRSTGITGEFKGPHEVRARFYFDGAPCWTEEWDWAPQAGTYLQLVSDVGALLPSAVDALGLVNKAGSYITHTRTRQNDCAYMQIEVDNKGASNPTFVPTEITLEIGVSPVLARISPHPAP